MLPNCALKLKLPELPIPEVSVAVSVSAVPLHQSSQERASVDGAAASWACNGLKK
jgi:hypothetical protein